MAKERKRQEVTSNFGTPWKPEKEGDTLEGEYIGYDEVPTARNGKKTFRSYRLKHDSGEIFGVAGAVLDRKFKQIPKGTYCWITYVGEMETSNGEAKDFRVECEQGTKLLSNEETDSDIPF